MKYTFVCYIVLSTTSLPNNHHTSTYEVSLDGPRVGPFDEPDATTNELHTGAWTYLAQV